MWSQVEGKQSSVKHIQYYDSIVHAYCLRVNLAKCNKT